MEAFSLTQAWPLWMLCVLPLVWFLALGHRTALGRWRLSLATILRSLALIGLALALADPVLTRSVRDISVVYALDISRSVSSSFVQSALQWIESANAKGRPAQQRYVVFADRAQLRPSLQSLQDVAVVQNNGDAKLNRALDQGATDLEQALDLSVFGFAPNHGKRLVLFTDGHATRGDVMRALPRLQAQGIPVYTFPAVSAAENDAWVESVDVAPGVRQQEPTTVRVRLFSRTETKAVVSLFVSDELEVRQSVSLAGGENQVDLRVQFKRSGENVLRVDVQADGDQVAENNALAATAWIHGKPRVIYVESAADSARYLREALTKQGIDVDVLGAGTFAQKLIGHDAVILSDVRPEDLGEAVARKLEAFVRDGGGLVFASGENTYGKEGFSNAALERLLPVKFEAPRKRKELDLVLLIDRSFSMRGQKLEYAKSAALSTLDLLEEQHRLSVVAFDSQPHEIVPLTEVGNKRRAEDLISGMTASGQTNLYNALWYGYRLLEKSPAKTKHMILLSDGNTAPPGRLAQETGADARMEIVRKARGLPPPPPSPDSIAPVLAGGFREMASMLAASNITLSTVAIGDKPNLELMSGLAKWTQGKEYEAKNESEIPSLFVAEAKRLMGESMVEEPFRPTVKAKVESLDGLDFAKAPQLKGFVLAKPRRYSEVLLEAKDQKPLLVQGHYGLGKTIVFLSDVKNRWSGDWLAWPGYGKLWSQVVREAIRRDSGDELVMTVARERQEAIVSLSALTVDGRFRNDLTPTVRVSTPQTTESTIALRQAGPGRYEARIPLRASERAPYRFELLEGGGLSRGELAKIGARSLYYGYSDEYRMLPPDIGLLKMISAQTGGKYAPKPDELFADRGDGGRVTKSLWPHFLALALLAYLLDLLVRRWPWRGTRAWYRAPKPRVSIPSPS